jgi:hypothetical protein
VNFVNGFTMVFNLVRLRLRFIAFTLLVVNCSFEIPRAALAQSVPRPRHVVQLEGPYNRAFVGGGGRYLVLYFSALKKIGVVDLVERKVVGYVTLGEEPRIAVGRDKFVVSLPSNREFVRYDLATCKPEQTTTYSEMGKVSGMTMGCDSSGPILLAHDVSRPSGGDLFKIDFIDLTTLLPAPIKTVDPQPDRGLMGAAWHATSDGRLFSNAQIESQLLIRIDGDAASVVRPDLMSRISAQLPDGDGQVLYGFGAFTPEGEKLAESETPAASENIGLYPAPRGPLVLGLRGPWAAGGGGGGGAANSVPASGDIFVRGDARPQLERIDFGISMRAGPSSRYKIQYDFYQPDMRERIFFVPHLKRIATVPDSFDQVIVHDFDFDEEVKQRADDYLFVYGEAPVPIVPGKPWSHQLDVRSKRGSLTYRIEKGPQGASVSPAGLVTWSPPSSASPPFEPVVVAVGDSTAREVKHTLRLRKGNASYGAAEPASGASPTWVWFVVAGLIAVLVVAVACFWFLRRRSLPAVALASASAPNSAAASPAVASPATTKPVIARPVTARPAVSGPAAGKSAAELRSWTSADGKVTIMAALVALKGVVVALKRADGRVMEVPLEKLSPADQAYARSRAKKS